ncbi:MAG: hypothetical protein ABSG98_06435 [Anaerolineales bacterium]|jgi:hypothetical protein
MSIQHGTEAPIIHRKEVVAPLPPAFVGGLSEACQEVVWAWLHDHAPKDLIDVAWYASEFDLYSREAEAGGGHVPADLATQICEDLPRVLETLQAHGGDLHAVCMIAGGTP